jgi:predicted RNA polymerase sigma factor
VDDAARTAEEVARRSYGRLVAFLAARTRDVAAAEDALSEAFLSALADWSKNGCPANPEGWLLTAARRKVVDASRRHRHREESTDHLQLMAEELEAAAIAPEIPDRRLALMFACAHPAIDDAVRAPLMLQVVLGLDAMVIASAFLTSASAMGKRLVRAKDKIRQAGISFRVPERAELASRLEAVLDAIYAAFGQGWADPSATGVARHGLALEALFLARTVNDLLPDEPEALGLLALILHVEARLKARRDEDGEFVPLAEQDQNRWNWPMIAEAEALLRRAGAFGHVGRYQIEAAIQSAHVHRLRTGESNWPAVLQLYDLLLGLTGSAVVAVNRAMAIAEVKGSKAGLASLPDIADDVRLREYQPFWAARADLLTRTSDHEEARKAYDIAIGLESDPAVRRFLQRLRQALTA